MRIRNFLANRFPALGRAKRLLAAILDICSRRSSFSQHREGKALMRLLRPPQAYDIGYIDIGANHPTSISNTYLLYRNGYTGYLIEPNRELVTLCRFFRPRDQVIDMGIAADSAIRPLQVSTTPTISSFNSFHFAGRRQTLLRVVYVPTMSLDDAFRQIPGRIGLLSIDVEGMNKEVLLSGLEVLTRSHCICIEHDTAPEAHEIREILRGKDFKHKETFGCNQIFVNQRIRA